MEQHRDKIYSPRFVGERFKEHTLPFEFLDDLQALEKINNEIARWLYLQEHPERKRVPKNFYKGISYGLTAIGEGSAVPQTELISPNTGLFPAPYHDYFTEAPRKLTEAIHAMEVGGDPSEVLPAEILLLLERFGSSLQADEFVEFAPSAPQKAKFTPEGRKKLLVGLSKDKDYTKDARILGEIIDLNKEKMTFELRVGKKKLAGPVSPDLYADFLEAFAEEPKGAKKPVMIAGSIRFNSFDTPKSIVSVGQLNILEPLDIQWQLESLKALKPGWFDGHGSAYDPAAIDMLSKCIDEFYSLTKNPSIYPNPEGLVNLEWDNEAFDITLEVDPVDRKGVYHSLDLKTRRSTENTLLLDLDADRKWLVEALRAAGFE